MKTYYLVVCNPMTGKMFPDPALFETHDEAKLAAKRCDVMSIVKLRVGNLSKVLKKHKSKKVNSGRKRKFVALLRNRTDSRDDEIEIVWAHTKEEAESLLQFNKTRFYLRGILTAQEARKNWV